MQDGRQVDKVPLIIGPFIEGSVLKLPCRAEGGRPQPSVAWLEGDLQLGSAIYTNSSRTNSEISAQAVEILDMNRTVFLPVDRELDQRQQILTTIKVEQPSTATNLEDGPYKVIASKPN